MRNIITFLVLLTVLLGATAPAFARGASSDDCAPGSTDPDCAGKGP
jgi:hypothetical protein